MEVNLHGRLICNSISMYCLIPTRLFLFLLARRLARETVFLCADNWSVSVCGLRHWLH